MLFEAVRQSHGVSSAVLRGWRFPEFPCSPPPAIITIRKTAKGYTLDSPWRPSPAHYRDRVDAVCAFIVDLIRAFVDEDRSLLCLHSAAAEFAGKLVVFPNAYRTGKSLFCAETDGAGKFVCSLNVLTWDEACEINPELSAVEEPAAAE